MEDIEYYKVTYSDLPKATEIFQMKITFLITEGDTDGDGRI